jgi:hypothetical protein
MAMDATERAAGCLKDLSVDPVEVKPQIVKISAPMDGEITIREQLRDKAPRQRAAAVRR